MHLNKRLITAAIASLICSSAWATNGYAPHGIGQKAQGMGGAGVAYPHDSLAGGINPAGMAYVGTRMDIGANLFRPTREATFIPSNTTYDANDKDLFLIPEFGYNRVLNSTTSVGVSVFGTGGMNTDYTNNPYGPFGMSGPAGVNLMQLFVVPTLAYKINDDHSIGIGLNLAAQAFAAKGIAGFGAFGASADPSNLSDNGHDVSYGAGLRVGWMGKVSERVTLGATYQTRTRMSEFDDYAGLFAEQGDFDIPENFAVGLAVAATPKLNIAFDVMRINYSEVKSIGNTNNHPFFGGPGVLGTDNGAGFNWQDQTIYKLGFEYAYSDSLTLRAGLNHADNPIPTSQTTFNVLAPGVVETHLTLGATWKLDDKSELTFSYMHALENSVNGDGSATGSYNLKMYQDALGIAYHWKM